MKKITILLIAVIASFVNPIGLSAEKAPISTTIHADPGHAEQKEVDMLVERLKQIESMDKSDLSRSEKKQLRSEVKHIEKRLVASSGGVYISAGALIVIIILLIILL